jgi:hypothetical protein
MPTVRDDDRLWQEYTAALGLLSAVHSLTRPKPEHLAWAEAKVKAARVALGLVSKD